MKMTKNLTKKAMAQEIAIEYGGSVGEIMKRKVKSIRQMYEEMLYRTGYIICPVCDDIAIPHTLVACERCQEKI